MIKYKIGKGANPRWEGGFVTMGVGKTDAKMDNRFKNMTITQIAKALSKQLDIKNGEILIHELTFSYSEQKERT